MSKINLTFKGKKYEIDKSLLAGAIASLEGTFESLSGPAEERLEGDGAEYYTLAPTALSFRSTAPLNELQEIQINGVTVDPSNYTLEEGSTIVTFPIEYLKTLNVGSYEVSVASESKTVKGGFTVAAPELNEYGFYYNQPYVGYVAAFDDKMAFIYREDGTADTLLINSEYTEVVTWTIDENTITINSSFGTTRSVVSTATTHYSPDVDATFVLGDESIVADDDYFYVYKEDLGGYEVQAIDKTKAEYSDIKTGINGIDTVKLADGAFAVSTDKYIKHENFIHCPAIPNSVTTIGDYAFYGCADLTSVTIPDSVTSIGFYAFSQCYSIASVTIPDGVTSIEAGAFSYCSNLTSVEIPNGVTNIRYGLFRDCRGLTSINIGSGVTRIEYDAFLSCNSLVNITFAGTMAQWKSITKANVTSSDTVLDLWNSDVPATYVTCSDGQVAL